MKKSSIINTFISFILITAIVVLPVITAYTIYGLFNPERPSSTQGVDVPILDQKRLDSIREKLSLRNHIGSSPAGSIDESMHTSRRADPFQP